MNMCSLPCGCGLCEKATVINLRIDSDGKEKILKFSDEKELRDWLVENYYIPHTKTDSGSLYFRSADWSIAVRMFDEDGKQLSK